MISIEERKFVEEEPISVGQHGRIFYYYEKRLSD